MPKSYCVYIITNPRNTVLYTGVTGNLVARIYYHKNKSVSSFSSKYNLEKLVYYEVYEDVNLAIAREKQIKAGSRKKKIDLINRINPRWKDLYDTIV
ncbi:MAG: GIY-YIG nuclease family protein [bacterium]|nr:GIY-YIG nuclease family protein [bacterium]